MHSQRYADRVNARYLQLNDPALNKATDAYIKLTELLGETKADDWFDHNIGDTDGWGIIVTKMNQKISELTDPHEENCRTIRRTALRTLVFEDTHPRPH
jgi:hypothetical protein